MAHGHLLGSHWLIYWLRPSRTSNLWSSSNLLHRKSINKHYRKCLHWLLAAYAMLILAVSFSLWLVFILAVLFCPLVLLAMLCRPLVHTVCWLVTDNFPWFIIMVIVVYIIMGRTPTPTPTPIPVPGTLMTRLSQLASTLPRGMEARNECLRVDEESFKAVRNIQRDSQLPRHYMSYDNPP